MKNITPHTDFMALTEAEVTAALDELEEHPETQNPVVLEVERLLAAYSARFSEYCKQYNEVPEEALSYIPQTPIEQAAFDIFTDALHDSMLEVDEEDQD